MGGQYVEVVITTYTKELDRAFTYAVPDNIFGVSVGDKVVVPFGNGNKFYQGYVIGMKNECDFKRIKKIKEVLPKFHCLTLEQLDLINYIRTKYLSSYTEAIGLVSAPSSNLDFREMYYLKPDYELKLNEVVIPENMENLIESIIKREGISKESLYSDYGEDGLDIVRQLVDVEILMHDVEVIEKMSAKYDRVISINEENPSLNDMISKIPDRSHKQKDVIKHLYLNGPTLYSQLREVLGVTKSVIDNLEGKGILKSGLVRDFKNVELYNNPRTSNLNSLNEDQENVYNEIKKYYESGEFSTHLIHGVTGSGKTEVYIKLIDLNYKRGKGSVVLVPEISLTPQLINRISAHFPNEVAVFHSRLTQRERFDQWEQIRKGKFKIIVGARSAIFLPIKDLGLIIMDEEHDNSYKSDSTPKYNTIDIARYLGYVNKCPVVLGSATPSIESSYSSITGAYKIHYLKNRHSNSVLPTVKIIDMRDQLINGNKSIFSVELHAAIEDRLNKKEQIILLLNRKGYSTFISCRECGFTLKCPNCDISLTYFKGDDKAKCSYCNYEVTVTKECPSCSSKFYKFFGAGTEKLEELTQEAFKDARVQRIDSTVSKEKGKLEEIIEKVENQEIDILIGTQLVAKGLDFSNVTLVGVINADSTLNLPDFQATERTFQVLTQVAGRAGRGEKAGEVYIQTYSPDNYAIECTRNHDYNQFFSNEIRMREVFKYPPFYKLCNIVFSSENESEVRSTSEMAFKYLKGTMVKNKLKNIEIIGPNPSVYSKIKRKYRYHILIKYKPNDEKLIRKLIKSTIIGKRDTIRVGNVGISIDISTNNTL